MHNGESIPPAPTLKGGPDQSWPHRQVYQDVVDALYALPGLFKSSLNVSGIRVGDLYTLNTALGASIEQSVVDSLNDLRAIWDRDGKYQLYRFVRQAQSWPDVLLRTEAPTIEPKIVMGLELKGWFVVAKEGEPSYRYKVSPGVCTDQDLLVVLPWLLSEIVSGSPRLLKPFVTEARYAAELRNYYWRHLRRTRGESAEVMTAAHQQPYPTRGTKFLDVPRQDPGGNFGRVARGGLMTEFIQELFLTPAAGIPLGAWQTFFKLFTERVEPANLRAGLMRISREYRSETGRSGETAIEFEELCEAILRFAKLSGDEDQDTR